MKKQITLHYFTPDEDNSRFCKHCGKYLTDEIHIRELKQIEK